MKKIKLLFTIYSLSLGGAEKSLVNLLNNLNYEKYDIDLYVFNNDGNSKKNKLISMLNQKINIIQPDKDMLFLTTTNLKILINCFSLKRLFYFFRLKFIGFNNKKNRYERAQEKWNKIFNRLLTTNSKKYDCAIGYMHSYPSYYVIDKVNATKKILWVHNDYSAITKNSSFDYNYFNQADEVITISNKCVEELKKSFPSIRFKFKCLYNYSPIEMIKKKADEYIPFEYSDNCVNIFSIGRLTEQKAFDCAIEAAKLLKKENIKFKWIIIGEGVQRGYLESLIDESIKDSVLLIGQKVNPYPYFKKCDFFVQTSRFEGKSIVVDEAKIFMKPIICTDYNTVGDQIIDNVNGYIVPVDDPNSLMEKIKFLIKNKDNIEKIKQNLKNEKFVSIEEYEKLFDMEC